MSGGCHFRKSVLEKRAAFQESRTPNEQRVVETNIPSMVSESMDQKPQRSGSFEGYLLYLDKSQKIRIPDEAYVLDESSCLRWTANLRPIGSIVKQLTERIDAQRILRYSKSQTANNEASYALATYTYGGPIFRFGSSNQ